jgi:hypothetical protein
MKTIQVHECDICGEHAKETTSEEGGYPFLIVEGFALYTCLVCETKYVCASCLGDLRCCLRKQDEATREQLNKETLFDLGSPHPWKT